MTRAVRLFSVTVAFLGGISAASAHHSFSALYDMDKQVEFEGRVVQVVFRNPHVFLHVERKDEKGNVERWAMEWGGISALVAAGITSTTFNIGDQVVIKANPLRRTSDNRMRLVAVTRPSDGLEWGTRPGQVSD